MKGKYSFKLFEINQRFQYLFDILCLDYFSLSVIFCSIFIVFGKRTSVSSNSTGNLKTTPETNVPNFNEFDWKLCKVGEYYKILANYD